MPDGDMRALGTHQYGNDMTNPDSSHYLDQAEDFTNEVLHQPLYSDQDRIGRITRRYDVRSD
jgi:penicillin amidase/acyl-homoserine-lactone acylase